MAIDISDLRVRIDQMTANIISGLKDRYRYKLNKGVFTEEVTNGKTWFDYRLFTEQKRRKMRIDIGERIIQFYRAMLPEFCEKGEEREAYGKTAKCDVNNVMLYNERVIGIGRLIAESKLQQNQEMINLSDAEIRKTLVSPEREKQVIEDAVRLAERYKLHKPEFIRKFFRGLIDLTVDAEVEYIRRARLD